MEALADQLSLALDSARLYEDTQRRAARDRLMGEVTTRMRETLDMDVVLQTAIRDIGQALNLAEVEVRMGQNPSSSAFEGQGRKGGGRMNFLSNELLQFVAWFLSLVVFILTLYIFMLNPRHTANRHVSGLLLLIAVNLLPWGLWPVAGELPGLVCPLMPQQSQPFHQQYSSRRSFCSNRKWLHGRWRWVLVAGLWSGSLAHRVDSGGHGTGHWICGTRALAPRPTVTGFVALGEFTTGPLGSRHPHRKYLRHGHCPGFLYAVCRSPRQRVSQGDAKIGMAALGGSGCNGSVSGSFPQPGWRCRGHAAYQRLLRWGLLLRGFPADDFRAARPAWSPPTPSNHPHPGRRHPALGGGGRVCGFASL